MLKYVAKKKGRLFFYAILLYTAVHICYIVHIHSPQFPTAYSHRLQADTSAVSSQAFPGKPRKILSGIVAAKVVFKIGELQWKRALST